MRTTRRSITFNRPFAVAALDGLQPPGTYAIEIDEKLIEGLSFLAYRRVATTIYLPLQHGGGRSVRAVGVEPSELATAYERSPL